MMKKIIFFDGDGTIWYPKKTRHKVPPHWIYKDKKVESKYLEHLALIPSALSTLTKLKTKGIILVLISTHPHPKKEADIILEGKIKHFDLGNIFSEFYSSRDYPEGKGELIVRILKKKKIPKTKALMVGDSYRYDYRSAKKVGVEAVLLNSGYISNKVPKKNIISSLHDLELLA